MKKSGSSNSERIITGHHALSELFKVRPKSVVDFWIDKGRAQDAEIKSLTQIAEKNRIRISLKEDSQIKARAGFHQGAMAISNERPELAIQEFSSIESGTIMVLDGVEDPHNLGAILRTAWLMGVAGIFIPQDRAVGLTPAAHKVASGGAEHVPVVAHHHFPNLFEELKELGFWIYGLSASAKSSLYSEKLNPKTVWVLGAEDKGIRKSTEKVCDVLISLPQSDTNASYNVSVAAAITLGETFRQRQMNRS